MKYLVALALSLALAGCTKIKYVYLDPEPDLVAHTPACGCPPQEIEIDGGLMAQLETAYEGPLRADIALVLDSEYVRLRRGQNPGASLDEIMQASREYIEEQVFPVFKRDFNLRLNVTVEVGFETWEEDPFLKEKMPGSANLYDYVKLINSFRDWSVANLVPVHGEMGAVILLTDRSIQVAGVAAGASSCRTFASGLARGLNWRTIAHELAHQFGVGHDLDNEYRPLRYIMARSISTQQLQEFSPRSKDHFAIWRARGWGDGSCVIPDIPEERPGSKAFVRGDVNDNGRTDLTDAIAIARYVTGSWPQLTCIDAADTNDDGKVQITDVIFLLTYLHRQGPKPDAPFEVKGLDPTPDDLVCK